MSESPIKTGSELQATPKSSPFSAEVNRRSFLRYTGATAVIGGMFLAGCKKDDDPVTPTSVSLGAGDVGVLNYAYALEQLEAAFYTQVVKSFYASAPQAEQDILKDIRDHEIIHREFFKKALGSNAIQGLTPDFSSIDFTSRTSVIDTAIAFEDLGVSAYNGAGKLIKSKDYLLLAGKIVSVEARHAAIVRDLKSNGTFAGSTDSNGLDPAAEVATVMATASKYIKETIDFSKVGM